ncbi:hypothetical protein ACJZ2D_005884 [Fusarium nematophilum]
MESNDDDGTGCLPILPKLFTPSPQPEIVLFTQSKGIRGSVGSDSEKPAAPTNADDIIEAKEDQTNDADGLSRSPKIQPVQEAQIDEEQPTLSDPLLSNSDPEEVRTKEEIPDEAIKELSMIVKAARNASVNLLDIRDGQSVRHEPRAQDSLERDESALKDPPGSGTAQSPQPLTKSRLRSIPETKLYNLGAIPHRLQDDGSKAATTGSDTPQPTDLDIESISAFEAPIPSPELESAVYYIIDPRSGGSAYYLFQETDVEDGYKAEKITLKVKFSKSGAPAYLIEASSKDQGACRRASHETLWRYNPDREAALVLNEQSHGPCEDAVDSSDVLNTGLGVSQDMVKKVNNRLRTVRHLRDHLHIVDSEGKSVREADGLYLVGDKDIRDVVRIVIEDMQRCGHIVDPERRCTKGSAGSRSLPRLDEVAKAIIPPSVTVADPATTISLPQTSYASINAIDMQVHTKTRGTGSDATTTVVSRRSVAEITWAQNYPPNYNLASSIHGRAVSDCCSPTHGALSSCFEDRRQSHPAMVNGEFVLRHYTTSKSTAEILSDIMCKKGIEKKQRVSDGTVITSFPRLLSRHCTNDWLSPPADIEDLKQPTSSTLYQQGIDAHRGNMSAASSNSHEEPLKPRQCNRSLFGDNPFSSKSNAAGTAKISKALAAEKRLGASLGVDTLRRRSTQVAGIENETAEAHSSFRPSLMDRIRQGSHKLFHRHHFRKSTEGTSTESREETGEAQGSGASRLRDNIVRQLAPEPPKPDRLGIYEAMTGSRPNPHRQRKNTCSEDNRPHVCENDFLTPSRAGSPA